NGAEVKHGAIEETPRGFRINDLAVTKRDALNGSTLAAASLEAASFEEQAAEGLVLTGAVFTDVVLTGKDEGSAKAARLAAERLAWSAAGRISINGFSARDIDVAPRPGEQVRIATFETALFRLDPAKGG